jgi:hypothetical protein
VVSGGWYNQASLAHLLRNGLCPGRIRYLGDIIVTEHPMIVDLVTYDMAQNQLTSQARAGCAETRTNHYALLRKLLICAPRGCGMTYGYGQGREMV